MNGDNKNLIFTILAVVGGIVVLLWALKLVANTIGLIILIAVVVFAVLFVQKVMGANR
jgi:hypothetical protein